MQNCKWINYLLTISLMKKFRFAPILALLLSSALLPACGGDTKNANAVLAANAANANSANANSARTNVEELALLVNVPYETEDIVWKEDAAHKKVKAVLRFSPDDSKKIVAEAGKFGPSQDITVETEVWFPDELTAQSDMSGDSELKGTSYPANAFFQEPYTTGRIIHIEGGDYFVIEMSAK